MRSRLFASPRSLAAIAVFAFFVIIYSVMDTRNQPSVPLHSNIPHSMASNSRLSDSSSLPPSPPTTEQLSNYGGVYNDHEAGNPSAFASEIGKQSESAKEYKELFPYGEESSAKESTPFAATVETDVTQDPPDYSQLFQSKSTDDIVAKLNGIPIVQPSQEGNHDNYAVADEHTYVEGSEAQALWEAAQNAYTTLQIASTTAPFAHDATDLPAKEAAVAALADDNLQLLHLLNESAPTTLVTSARPFTSGSIHATGLAGYINTTEVSLTSETLVPDTSRR